METLETAVKKHAKTISTLGILSMIFGVLAILAPIAVGMTAMVMIGALVLLAGIARCVVAFHAESWGRGALGMIVGALTVFCGLFLVTKPLFGVAALSLVLTAYLFADGVFSIMFSFKMKPIPGWGYILTGGIFSLVLGYLIAAQWPLSGAAVVGWYLGLHMLFSGWTLLTIGKACKNGFPERFAKAA